MSPSTTVTVPKKGLESNGGLILDRGHQVVLYNDPVNVFQFVVSCLMQVFGHPAEMAYKLTMEAHSKGRSIVEVEGKSEAVLHKEQLVSFGLTAEVESI